MCIGKSDNNAMDENVLTHIKHAYKAITGTWTLPG